MHAMHPHSVSPRLRFHRGFTLIELLLVIGIIAILAAIVIVAINPTKQLADARNARRRSDITTIVNAVYQYAIDHNGTFPVTVTQGVVKPVCQDTMAPATCVSVLNGVSLRLLSGTYLTATPKDPQITATATGTRYTITEETNGRVTVTAIGAELGATITTTK